MDPWWQLAALAGASVSAFLLVDAVAGWIERRLRKRPLRAVGPAVPRGP